MRRLLLLLLATFAAHAEPLTIGETFTIRSSILAEERRINVYRPPADPASPLPVLYMPDGGLAEDFLHVAGLVQVLAGNGTMRPFLLVGIENTERRRDLTGPTDVARDLKIAPRVGGSAKFRAFLRDELMPEIGKRYRVTKERAIVGESLAGLFVVETLLVEPELFDTYLAFDPSLWWNHESLVAVGRKRKAPLPKTLYLATSDETEIVKATERLAAALRGTVRLHYEPMPRERHSTIYHPAALRAFRMVLAK
jgi:predicted alpha/beta superfamily hydrolase